MGRLLLFTPAPEFADAVDAGDLFACRECHELSDGDHCPTCDDGRCAVCLELVAKGTGDDERWRGGELCCRECSEAAIVRWDWPAWARAVFEAVA